MSEFDTLGPSHLNALLDELAERIAERVMGAMTAHQRAPERPYTVAEAAKVLGMSERSVYRLIAQGVLPILETDIGGKRIPAAAIQDYVTSARRLAPMPPAS